MLYRSTGPIEGEGENTISCPAGTVMKILEKDQDGDGWWLADLNGVVGYVPDELLEPAV
jgi:hypothetical protein